MKIAGPHAQFLVPKLSLKECFVLVKKRRLGFDLSKSNLAFDLSALLFSNFPSSLWMPENSDSPLSVPQFDVCVPRTVTRKDLPAEAVPSVCSTPIDFCVTPPFK